MIWRFFDRPYLLLTLTSLFWAGNNIVGKAVHESISPVGLTFWRWAVALLIIAPFAWPHIGRDRFAIRADLARLTVFALTGIALFNVLLYSALHHVTALNASLLASAIPILIVALSVLIYREKIGLRTGLGMFVSLAGVLVIIGRGNPEILLSLSLNPGDLIMLGAVISYAIYSVLLKQRPAIHPLSFLAVTFALGLAMLTPFYLWEILFVAAFSPNLPVVGAILYTGVLPSILAYLFFNRGVELVGPAKGGLFIHLIPVFAGIMAVVFLDERFFWFHAVGTGLVFSGIWLASRERKSV